MPTGDITSMTIVTETNGMPYLALTFTGLATGGTFAFGMGTNNDPAAAKVVLTVTSPSFDATGSAGTVTRTVYGTRVMRQAYPNDALDDVTTSGSDCVAHIALSDFIYSGDTVTIAVAAGLYTKTGVPTNALAGGTAVTNSATNTHPKPVGRFVTVPYQRVTGNFTVEYFGGHRSAKNGKPLACVVFTATDQHSHTATVTVTAMTLSAANANGIRLPVYAATIPVATFTDGDTITVNAKAYPWVGNATLDSDLAADGFAQPDERLGPQTYLLDVAGSNLPPLYAVVDSATGSSSGVASTTLATAEATRCNTIATAKTKLAAVRANGENCFIYLVDNGGTGYAFAGSAVAFNQTSPARVWTTIGPHPTLGTKAGCPISSGDNSNATGKFRFSGMKLSNASTGALVSDGNGLLWLDNSLVNLTGSVAAVYQWRLAFFTDCDVTGYTTGLVPFSTSKFPPKLVRGTVFETGASLSVSLYCAVANTGDFKLAPVATGNSASQQITSNAVAAYNKVVAYSDASNDWCKTDPNTAHSDWLVACNAVCCAAGSRSQSLVNLKGDSDVAAGNNFLVWHNALCSPTNASSARANLGYNDTGANAPARKDWSIVGCNFGQYNNKDDATVAVTANAARTGAWSVGYMLGAYGNVIEAYGSTGDAEHSFGPESAGLYTKDQPQTQAYTNTATGDLTPASGSPSRNLIPAARAVLPYDLAGSPYSASGTTVTAGAYQYAADFTAAASPSGGAFGSAQRFRFTPSKIRRAAVNRLN